MTGRKPAVVRIGERISELRRQRGLTQDKLAEQIGLGWTGATLSHYETGEREMGVTAFLSIADALDARLDTLAGREQRSDMPGDYDALIPENREIIDEMVQVLLRRQNAKSA